MTLIGLRRRGRGAEAPHSTVDEAVAALRDGQMVIIVDGENPDDYGDLMLVASHANAGRIAFMVRHTGGILAVPMIAGDLDRLALPPMVAVNARTGIGSGVSAADRARTIALLADPATSAADLTRPGYVFPLRAVDGGVLRRSGHTEAAVDLARLTGLFPAAVLGEILGDDGTLARGETLRAFAAAHGLPTVTVADLIAYRHRTERLVEFRAASRMPTRYGDFQAHGFESVLDGREHIALVMGDVMADAAGRHPSPTLVRVQSECLTGNVFGSAGCDCDAQLRHAMRAVAAEGRGVVVYLRGHDGRVDHQPADARDYGVGAQILAHLGVRRMRLLTNNPVKRVGLEAYGLEITEAISMHRPTPHAGQTATPW
ncbi:3,4-dihydroxy-2-butanone-4-phosphate synthase [Mycolicibacterium litorale]|uniref:3,4-dihydroxy-2-butanone-4-phosphate synthase n=1 Tax=Mycolicibacterium litorale TaxID=758802 RepID=UPI003CF72497